MSIADPPWETLPGVHAGVTPGVNGITVVSVWTGVGVSGTGVVGRRVVMVTVEAGGWGGTFSPVHPDARIE
jgi:hypothetical protein